MIPVTGVARKNTIFLEERLGLTNWRQSYRLTGTHPSPRSVSVWRLTNSSGSSSSTSRLTLCTQLSLMGNTETRHWDVTHDGGSWLVQKASSQIYRNREGFNLYPLTAYWEFKAAKARIGFITNNANNCIDVDTRIGFGTRGPHDDNNTCGIVADESGLDNGSKFIKAMGYILVQWRAEIVHIVINNVNITTLINNNNEKLRKKGLHT